MKASHNQSILILDWRFELCEHIHKYKWKKTQKLNSYNPKEQDVKELSTEMLDDYANMNGVQFTRRSIQGHSLSVSQPPLLMSAPFLDRFISMFHCQIYSYFNCHFHRLLLSDCVHFCHSLCFHRTFDASTLYRQNNFKGNAFDLISQVKCKGQDQKEFSENC